MTTKVLVLSRNYPNDVLSVLGLWVEQWVLALVEGGCEVRVVAPVPYCPPLPGLPETYARFRRVPRRQVRAGIEVWHPRFVIGPGYSSHDHEARSYYWGVHRTIRQLREHFDFDLIHAHFTYPDGVVGARLAREFGVPLVITEHALWVPWMERHPRVRAQAVWAAGECAFHTAVSRFAAGTIEQFTGPSEKLRVLPVGVNGQTFTLPPDRLPPDPDRILYVGQIVFNKGLDILFQAMGKLVEGRPGLKLVLLGGTFGYKDKQLQEARLQQMARDLGLDGHVEFAGQKAPGEVAAYMQASAVLVLPSRAESFGAVLAEALACGTPVVATRCGGPEDIVVGDVGRLVPPEDPDALAEALSQVLSRREDYDAGRLRAYALERFSWEQVASRTLALYQEALEPTRDRPGNRTRPLSTHSRSVPWTW